LVITCSKCPMSASLVGLYSTKELPN